MSRTPARFTQADVARAIRAAKQAGAGDVTVEPDGSIVIRLSSASSTHAEGKALDEERVIPL
jgi:hypothetical protein